MARDTNTESATFVDTYNSELIGSAYMEEREAALDRERVLRECDSHAGTMDGPRPPMTPRRAKRLAALDAALERLQMPSAYKGAK